MAVIKNNKSFKARTLNVYEKLICYNAYYTQDVVSHFPEIRLMGKWLADCGFMAGQYIDVTVEQNKLTITRNFLANGETDLKTDKYEKQKAAKFRALVERASGKACEP
jgi:hypothetical protein